jgi:hypothetical protein
MPEASLNQHQQCANYGTFMGSPVVYMYSIWCAVSTRVTNGISLVSMFPPTPLTPNHLPVGSAGVVSFLGHIIRITCTGVQHQDSMNKWLQNAVPPDSCHRCSVVYPHLYWSDQRNIKNLLQTSIFTVTIQKTSRKQKIEVCSYKTVPGWILWERSWGSAVEHTALNPTEFLGPPPSYNNFKQHAQPRPYIVSVLATQVDDNFGLH